VLKQWVKVSLSLLLLRGGLSVGANDGRNDDVNGVKIVDRSWLGGKRSLAFGGAGQVPCAFFFFISFSSLLSKSIVQQRQHHSLLDG